MNSGTSSHQAQCAEVFFQWLHLRPLLRISRLPGVMTGALRSVSASTKLFVFAGEENHVSVSIFVAMTKYQTESIVRPTVEGVVHHGGKARWQGQEAVSYITPLVREQRIGCGGGLSKLKACPSVPLVRVTPPYHSKLDLSHGTAPRLPLTTVDSNHLLPEVCVARGSLDLLSHKLHSWANQCI